MVILQSSGACICFRSCNLRKHFVVVAIKRAEHLNSIIAKFKSWQSELASNCRLDLAQAHASSSKRSGQLSLTGRKVVAAVAVARVNLIKPLRALVRPLLRGRRARVNQFELPCAALWRLESLLVNVVVAAIVAVVAQPKASVIFKLLALVSCRAASAARA